MEPSRDKVDGNTDTSTPVRKTIIHTKHFCFTVENFEIVPIEPIETEFSLFFQKVQTYNRLQMYHIST